MCNWEGGHSASNRRKGGGQQYRSEVVSVPLGISGTDFFQVNPLCAIMRAWLPIN